jgi:arginine repressor
LKKCSFSQSQVSQFLNKLKLEKIVNCEKKWKEVYYYITDNNTLLLIESLKKNFL